MQDSFSWFLIGVYAPHIRSEKLECWEEVTAVQLCGGPWVVCGDFNTVRTGRKESAARLDRFLYYVEWEEFFKNIKQMVMPRVTSGHCPILLQCDDWEKQRPYFKFKNWWLEIDGFRELVHKWWNEFEVIGSPYYVLSLKLRMLKKKITEWSKLACGGLDIKKRNLLAEFADIDLVQDTRALNEDEMIVRTTVLVELEKLAKNEEARWRQKSRVLWLKQGDNNTNFFQRMATTHKRYNAIDKLVIRGEEIKDPDQIKVSMIEFYKNLYSESESWRPAFGIANCPRISQEDQEWLQRPFTEVEILAGNLGCQVASLPTKYLGMPLGAKNKELEVWNEILQRSERKLAKWKSQYLSLGGRLTLIKSIMDDQPTYMMSLFPLPVSIEKKINKARRVFLWQGNKEKKGYNLVKWDKVTLSKEQGGLGIKKLRAHNRSLLKKWLWRFCCEDMALWRRFISQIYGLLNSWMTEEVTGTFGCSVWQTIRRLWFSFSNNLKYKIGNVEKTNFWNELCIGEENLKTTFPDVSLQQMDKVAQVWSPQGWNLIFRRALNDWEINRMVELLQVLNFFLGVNAGPDMPVWKLHNKGSFTVKSCYWRLNYSRTMKNYLVMETGLEG
ncbi:hypothetical protein H5410_057776 [Solanum commersonii]|uniref:Uncharacterized protein n=1 Tax=Solanum commersonii TaxID=4109 RepID=A0A9J5WPW7_SOLCO|nr:hypothetical protein H5410_057776 [Solanum commersonii]